ncbi:MAG: hypothetical protein NT039_03065 [Candidatus Berkelbacteria bacterium]|nr:hypothetical protein [Candidatus Berkelbacteria bacterium]
MIPSIQNIVRHLMFQVQPSDFEQFVTELRAKAVSRSNADVHALLAEAVIALNSALPLHHLSNTRFHPRSAVSPEQLGAASDLLLTTLEADSTTYHQYATQQIGALEQSQLLRLAQLANNGEHNTWWGHDYASGLWEAMLKGAILVTTNPVLVGLAAKQQPGTWTPVRDKLRENNPTAEAETIARLMTIKVVVANARLLRDIWTLSDRKLGLVSLQLSPKTADNADVMIADALDIYDELCCELDGTPNTVFKVPGTKAGITVARELTKRGIGVNITVNFALPQQIAFAGAIEDGTATLSFRTQMDGRVDDPIGEELREAGVLDWEEVKTWATTAIRQRDYGMLCLPPEEGGLGFTRSFCLGASGRGPWNILRSVCNGPAPLFLTVFPDRQVEFDAEPRELDPSAIWQPIPPEKLDTLRKSRIFCQAYEPDGMSVDEFDTYLPVERTLAEFCTKYDAFVKWCGGAPIEVLN